MSESDIATVSADCAELTAGRNPSHDDCHPSEIPMSSVSSWFDIPPPYDQHGPPADQDQKAPPYGSTVGQFWPPKAPPYTTDEPPGYDVPSQHHKAPSVVTPIIIQPGIQMYINDFLNGGQRIVHVTDNEGPPIESSTYMGLAIFTCVFCNWIIGTIAIFYSARAQKAHDYTAARWNAKVSLCVSGLGVFLGVITYVLILVVIVD